MPEKHFDVETQPKDGGWGGYLSVSSDSASDSTAAVIIIEVQAFKKGQGEEMATLSLLLSPNMDRYLAKMDLPNATIYGACIAAQVGAQVWRDYSDCKNVEKKNNPNGTWSEIHKAALKCLADKSQSAKAAFDQAMITCSPSMLP
ncbi:MAG: hypothetical protein V2J51_07260 [Erythrobacter sp.]|jgi:hypothetical protein|nr:hypothetical protein [Erythrobacter sp.]